MGGNIFILFHRVKKELAPRWLPVVVDTAQARRPRRLVCLGTTGGVGRKLGPKRDVCCFV
jgi:hypothetical protein